MYNSINQLDQFEYHDAHIENIKIDGTTMIWQLQELNIKATAPENCKDIDLCIKEAFITFDNCTIESVITAECIKMEQRIPSRLVSKNEYKTALNSCHTIFNMEECEKTDSFYRATFDLLASGYDDYIITLNFNQASVVWDTYSGPAWYVKRKSRKQKGQGE